MPASADATPDPTLAGPYGVVATAYDLGVTGLAAGGAGTSPVDTAYVARLNGSVHFPATGDGPFPMIVLMHGRHTTCREGAYETIGNRYCLDYPDALPVAHPTDPIDSFRGYDQLAANLASHGYVVASVNANDVNNGDQMGDYGATARAQLVLRTIDRFGLLAAGLPVEVAPVTLLELAGRIDMTRIGLMGHSRGGEGVARAVTLNQANFDGSTRSIVAVFALAPTDFARWSAPNVALGTLLPYCDGDVYNLQGEWLYDDNRLASEATPTSTTAFLAMGANHNWYNAIWSFDDVRYASPNDPYCGTSGTGRLSMAAQQQQGVAIMASFLRLHVGGESDFGPALTGAAPLPNGAGNVRLSYMPGADARRVVEDGAGAATTTNDLGGATTVAGFAGASVCTPSACPGFEVSVAPQLLLRWNGAATLTTTLPAAARDVRGFSAISLRGALAAGDALNTGAAGDFRIVLVDAGGQSASMTASSLSSALLPPPGAGFFVKNVLSDVRAPLSGFTGVDLANVAAVKLVFDATPQGAVTVADLAFV